MVVTGGGVVTPSESTDVSINSSAISSSDGGLPDEWYVSMNNASGSDTTLPGRGDLRRAHRHCLEHELSGRHAQDDAQIGWSSGGLHGSPPLRSRGRRATAMTLSSHGRNSDFPFTSASTESLLVGTAASTATSPCKLPRSGEAQACPLVTFTGGVTRSGLCGSRSSPICGDVGPSSGAARASRGALRARDEKGERPRGEGHPLRATRALTPAALRE
jgi:hypothetical protein